MAKFSVFLNDNPIHSAIFESGVVHIGRDESNDISINSLAFAPAHAAVILRDDESIIKQLNADFPLIINGKRQSKRRLKNGDSITIGKHRIVYNPINVQQADTPSPPSGLQSAIPAKLVVAQLQIMAGKHRGHIVPLKKNMTRIGQAGSGIMIITHRKEGFFASVLEPAEDLKVNNRALENKSILLKNSDLIYINKIPMKFSLTEIS